MINMRTYGLLIRKHVMDFTIFSYTADHNKLGLIDEQRKEYHSKLKRIQKRLERHHGFNQQQWNALVEQSGTL